MRQGVEGLQHQPLGRHAELRHRAVADAHVQRNGHLGRCAQHLAYRRGDGAAAAHQQHVLARVVVAHLVEHGAHATGKFVPARHALRADDTGHPLCDGVAQQAEMVAVQLGGVRLLQRLGVDGADQRVAVVLVQARQGEGFGQARQALGDAFKRLHMAAQRAQQHGVEALAAFAPVFAQAHRLLAAQGAELVVVVRAKRGLAMAHKVKGSHGRDCGQKEAMALVTRATRAMKIVAYSAAARTLANIWASTLPPVRARPTFWPASWSFSCSAAAKAAAPAPSATLCVSVKRWRIAAATSSSLTCTTWSRCGARMSSAPWSATRQAMPSASNVVTGASTTRPAAMESA